MLSAEQIGRRIALLRKEKRLSQEQLAEELNVSPQAVSKWETGKSIPETASLPLLARVLGQSIDSILLPRQLVVLSAVYTDGEDQEDVTQRVNAFVSGDRLRLRVEEGELAAGSAAGDRVKVLLVKLEAPAGIFFICALEGELLDLRLAGGMPEGAPVYTAGSGELQFIHGVYGNRHHARNVMNKLAHYRYFQWNGFIANHEQFPSLTENEGPDYLLLVYLNEEGLHAVSCREGERIRYNADRTRLYRDVRSSDSYIVAGVGQLGFGKGQDCSWAGALLLSLKTMGVDTSYETVMGVSGACWRIAFASVWDFSSADALVACDYAAPAFQAYGIKPIWADRISKEERKRVKEQIVSDVESHRLPVAINLRVAPEWGVITGYADMGNTLLCRTYFDEEVFVQQGNDPAFQEEMARTGGYLYVDNWPFALVRMGETSEAPLAVESLLASLRLRMDTMGKTENAGYKLGYAAFEAWRLGLTDDSWYIHAKEEDVKRRYLVNRFCLAALSDARRSASVYLASSRKLLPEGSGREQLDLLSGLYARMAERLEAALACFPEKEPAAGISHEEYWPQEARKTQAELLLWAAGQEAEADQWVQGILEAAAP